LNAPSAGSLRPLLVGIAVSALLAGAAATLAGRPDLARWCWTGGTVPVLLALVAEIVTSLRRGDLGLDIVAALSMTAALAVGEALAAAVVALMYSGGQYLELFAERRARREMTALLARVPHTALCYRDGALEEIPLGRIVPGDRLLIRRGDVVPVDGIVAAGVAVLDESALTGEAMPVRHPAETPVMSGPINVGEAFDLTAERPAAASTFAGIVRLVEQAQRLKAPMVRLADRYAIGFLGLTLVIAGAAWALTGEPVRAVAVLVVATPCPLILAVPVALVAGLSRAAKHGVLIKGAKALEQMARIAVLVLDKTGTLTEGRPALLRTATADGWSPESLLRLAASLDQASKHPVAETLVAEARGRGLALATPEGVVERSGEGLRGLVDGHEVLVGGRRFVADSLGVRLPERDDDDPGAVTVAVGIDGLPAGELVLSDRLRAGIPALLAELRALGIVRQILATGDRHEVAAGVAGRLDLDAVHADLTPERKVELVREARRHGPVMMVGDGVNDAPALAAADVGVAMGARGAAASAEAADVVLLVDDLGRLLTALRVARRARQIALQSVVVGIGLSVVGMVAAAFGLISPVQGALLQEAIDVAVILNALRALGPARRGG
jgi:heavy metal translocating P-type ATPase